MLASLSALLVLSSSFTPQAKAPAVAPMLDPARLKADFNKAKGVPRVIIILSPS